MYSKMFYCVMSSYSILSKSAIFTNRGIEDGAFCIGTFSFFPPPLRPYTSLNRADRRLYDNINLSDISMRR